MMKRVIITLALIVMFAIMSKIASAEDWTYPNTWTGPTSEDILRIEKGEEGLEVNFLPSLFFRGHYNPSFYGIWGLDSDPKENSVLNLLFGQLEVGARENRTELGGFPLEFSLLIEAVPLLLDGTGYNVQETLYLTGLRFRLWGETSAWYAGITGWYPTELGESANIVYLNGVGDFWGTFDFGYAEEEWSLKLALGYPRSMARLDVVMDDDVQWGLFVSVYIWGFGGEHKLRIQDGTSHEYLYQKYSGELGVTWAPDRAISCQVYLMAGVQSFDPVRGGIDPPDYWFLGAGVRVTWNAD